MIHPSFFVCGILSREEESTQYITLLSKEKRDYESIQVAFKSAVAQRREKQRERAVHAREELLRGSQDIAGARKQLQTESDIIRTSENITDSLRRTRNIMAQELEHSGAQLAAIEMSKERLLKAKSEYGDQHSLLSKSKGLIKVINWQNKSERYLLWAGLLLFCLVAMYIIQKRFLYFVPHSMRPMALLRYVAHMLCYIFKKKHTSQHEEEEEDHPASTIPAPDEL